MFSENVWPGMLEMQHAAAKLNFLIWSIGEVADPCWNLCGEPEEICCPFAFRDYHPPVASGKRTSSLINVYAENAPENWIRLRNVIEPTFNPSDLSFLKQG